MARRSRLLAPLLAAAVLGAAPAWARTREFDRIVDRVSEHYHKRPGWGMGLLSFFGGWFAPAGVHDLRMAVIEDAPEPREEPLDGFIEREAGPGFRPFVKVRSAKAHETTYIFARETGRNVDLLLVSLEPREAVVMEMRLEPEAFAQWLDDPEGMAKRGGR